MLKKQTENESEKRQEKQKNKTEKLYGKIKLKIQMEDGIKKGRLVYGCYFKSHKKIISWKKDSR